MSSALVVPRWLGWGSAGVALAFWVAFVGVPLVSVLGRLDRVDLLLDPGVLAVARITLEQALLSTFFSALLGLPLGLWIGRLSGRAGRWCEALLALPFGVPSIVAAMSWVVLLGRSGWLARLELAYSLEAVILAHVFFNAPWIALLVAQSRRGLPERLREAALTLGAGRWAVFRFVLWPQVRWAFLSAAGQTLSFCVMSFALVLVLGGGPPVQTLETALYGRMRYGTLDLAGAVACGVWELALTLLPWALVLFFQAKEGERRKAAGDAGGSLRSHDSKGRLSLALLVCGLFVVPYFSVFFGAFGKIPADAFWADIQAPLWISLKLASLTGLGSVALAAVALACIGFLNSRGRAWRGGNAAAVVLLLPGGMSALVLGLGLWIAYGRWIDPFAGSLLAMVALQIALFFPIAFRALWPLAQAMPRRRLEAALTLGASPWRAFWLVDWPRWRGPVASTLGLVVAASISEVAAVSLFYSEELIPLPLLVSRWMGQYRFEEAQAVAALLFGVSMLAIVLLRFVDGQRAEAFGSAD